MISDLLKNNLIPSSDYISGFADLNGLLPENYSDFAYGISIGKRLDDKIIDGIKNGPTTEYYNYYKQVNTELAALAGKINTDFIGNGIEAMLVPPTVSSQSKGYSEYLRTLTVDISHKMVATRAGLGWIGKTDLFISKAFGPRLRLTSILLKQNPGKLAVPVVKSKCGTCIICIQKCPAKAGNGKSWNIHVHRDEFFDAHKCRQQCGEFGKQLSGEDQRICGICVSVCPIGRKN
jgi:epoxyqueuosine reductase